MSSTLAQTYDGIQELTGAAESPGSGSGYIYDPAGNRTSASINGAQKHRCRRCDADATDAQGTRLHSASSIGSTQRKANMRADV